MKYHKLHSNEIYTRIKEVGKRYSLLVLILLVDTANHWRVNREMTRLSVLTGFTVVLAWEDEEAARYIETLKAYEYKSPEAIRERTGDTPIDKVSLCPILIHEGLNPQP